MDIPGEDPNNKKFRQYCRNFLLLMNEYVI